MKTAVTLFYCPPLPTAGTDQVFTSNKLGKTQTGMSRDLSQTFCGVFFLQWVNKKHQFVPRCCCIHGVLQANGKKRSSCIHFYTSPPTTNSWTVKEMYLFVLQSLSALPRTIVSASDLLVDYAPVSAALRPRSAPAAWRGIQMFTVLLITKLKSRLCNVMHQ